MAGILDELREAVPLARALKGLVGETESAMAKLATAAATVLPSQEPGTSAQADASTVSTGSGGGGGSRNGPRMFRSKGGKFSRPEDWVKEHGVQTTVLLGQDEVLAWDCTRALGDPLAIFVDPDALQALMQKLRPSTSGHGTRTTKHPGAPTGRTEYAGTAYDPTKPFTGSTGNVTPSVYPSVVSSDEAIRLLRDIRDQGRQDGSLARRTGGRP